METLGIGVLEGYVRAKTNVDKAIMFDGAVCTADLFTNSFLRNGHDNIRTALRDYNALQHSKVVFKSSIGFVSTRWIGNYPFFVDSDDGATTR